MAMTPDEIDALPDFTTTQRLKRLRLAIAKIEEGGQAYGIDGRSLTRADLAAMYEQEKKLAQELADEEAGESGGGNVLVKFGQPQ